MSGDAPNVLVLRLQPDEGINLLFGAKKPGPTNEISPVTMDFYYQQAFGSTPPEAYERLLLDCIQGDQTLFTRNDEVLEQWKYVSGIIKAWEEKQTLKLPQYKAGTWGLIMLANLLKRWACLESTIMRKLNRPFTIRAFPIALC